MYASTILVLASALSAGPRFEDVTAGSGIPPAMGSALDSNVGSPAAWIDFDQDGYPDLVIGDSVGPTRLLRNPQGTLPFVDVTPPALAAITSVRAIDHLRVAPGQLQQDAEVARDGLVLTTGGQAREEIRVIVFTDGRVDQVPVGRPAPRLTLLSHGDLDGDGAHDIIAGVSACGAGSSPIRTVFRLERYCAGYRLSDADPVSGPGCFPVPFVTDYFGTGRPTLMVATDFGPLDAPSYLYRDGRFEGLPGVYGMGIATGDVNGDDVLDYVVTSAGPDLLWRSSNGGRELAAVGRNTEWGESAYRFKWGAAYADLDNDGDLELWMTSGFGGPQSGLLPSEVNSRDVLVDGGVDIAESAGIDALTTKRAVALADYDLDGRLDAFVIGLEANYLYHNVTSDAGHWLELVMPDEPGARAWVTACGRTWTRERSGGLAGVAHESLVHVGLGNCAEPATVRVRWPWLAERTYGPFPADSRASIEHPGSVWVSPVEVAPGGQIAVHASLSGPVTVDGKRLDNAFMIITASTEPGEHRLAITWDGAPVSLAPKYTVVATTTSVLTDPWPPRIGRPARLISQTPEGGEVAVAAGGQLANGSITASSSVLELRVAGQAVSMKALANVGGAPRVDVETTAEGLHVRAAFLDELGTMTEFGSAAVSLAVSGGAPEEMHEDAPPWFVGDLGGEVAAISVHAGGGQATELAGLSGPAGPVDLGRSRIWLTTPIVRGDGQDLIEVALMLRDSAGRLVEPDESWLPRAPGCAPVDSRFTRSAGYFGSTTWIARLRAPQGPGRIEVTAGGLGSVAWAVAAEPAEVDLATTLERTESGYLLTPRDRYGQRLGSGVTTVPEFQYVGLGQYRLDSPADAVSVVVGGTVHVHFADGKATNSLVLAESSGCSVGVARSSVWPVWCVLLVGILARMGRRRSRRSGAWSVSDKQSY